MIVEIDALGLAAVAVPTKNQPPLAVDADRLEPSQIAAQLLEVIAGRHPQGLVGRRVVDHLELAEEPAFQVGRNVPRPRVLDEERAQPLVSKGPITRQLHLCVYVPLMGTKCNICACSRSPLTRSDCAGCFRRATVARDFPRGYPGRCPRSVASRRRCGA